MRTPTERHWLPIPPGSPGYWYMRCDENGLEAEVLMVVWGSLLPDKPMELWVVDREVGTVPLDLFHNGLTNTQWQYKEPLRAH